MNIDWYINRANTKIGSKNSKKYFSMKKRIAKWSNFSNEIVTVINSKGPEGAESLKAQLEEVGAEVELKEMVSGWDIGHGGSLVIEQTAE